MIVHEQLHHTANKETTVILISAKLNNGCTFRSKVKYFESPRAVLTITLAPEFKSQDKCEAYLAGIAKEIEQRGSFMNWLDAGRRQSKS